MSRVSIKLACSSCKFCLDATKSCFYHSMSIRPSPLCLCVSTTSADALPGVLRWQSRLWQLVTKLRGARELGDVPNPSLLKKKELAETKKIWGNKNYAIQEVESPQPQTGSDLE